VLGLGGAAAIAGNQHPTTAEQYLRHAFRPASHDIELSIEVDQCSFQRLEVG
jgi:hypothetical protein